MPPKNVEPIRFYFAKQNKCFSLLSDTNKPITNSKRLYTLIGHLQAVPSMQVAINNYNKLVQAEGANKTQKISLKKI